MDLTSLNSALEALHAEYKRRQWIYETIKRNGEVEIRKSWNFESSHG
jgi:hypothetical protein